MCNIGHKVEKSKSLPLASAPFWMREASSKHLIGVKAGPGALDLGFCPPLSVKQDAHCLSAGWRIKWAATAVKLVAQCLAHKMCSADSKLILFSLDLSSC